MRHPTEENKTYASGRKREATKNIIERRKRDAKGRFEVETPSPGSLGMDESIDADLKIKSKNPTADKQAKEEGVSHWTIEANAKFAKGVDLIKEVNPELAKQVLEKNKEGPNFTKKEIRSIEGVRNNQNRQTNRYQRPWGQNLAAR